MRGTKGKSDAGVPGVMKKAPLPVTGSLKTVGKPSGNVRSTDKPAGRVLGR